MDDLVIGVHAGVGAAGGDDFNRVVGNCRQHTFNFLLNAGSLILKLPPGVGGAEIINPRRPAFHIGWRCVYAGTRCNSSCASFFC